MRRSRRKPLRKRPLRRRSGFSVQPDWGPGSGVGRKPERNVGRGKGYVKDKFVQVSV